MHNGLKRGLAAVITACLALGALTGCTKKAEEETAAAQPLVTVGDESVNTDAFNFYMRYQQTPGSGNYIAQEASWYKMLYSYYGMDIDPWNTDLEGSGQTLGDQLKANCVEDVKKMLLAKAHMEELGVEFTDADKEAAAKAAADFVAANGEDALKAMNATPETIEQVLTLMAIRERAEEPMGADVDTEVSDEEAAQTRVSYVYVTPQTETEAETELPEEGSESAVEEGAFTEETEVKTNSSDETEEGVEEISTEAQTETEDPALAAAKEEAYALAVSFLAQAKENGDFEAAAASFTEEYPNAFQTDTTIGADSVYPSEEIVKACFGLEDGTLVDQVFEANDNYYICYVEDGFDEEATEDKKVQIVEQRRTDLVNSTYEEWEKEQTVTVDETLLASMLFNFTLSEPVQAQTEGLVEDLTELSTEIATESAAE